MRTAAVSHAGLDPMPRCLPPCPGLLLPWGPEGGLTRPTCIADRFFLGGPSSLRGFKYKVGMAGPGRGGERRGVGGHARER